jgi:hypothetical protein
MSIGLSCAGCKIGWAEAKSKTREEFMVIWNCSFDFNVPMVRLVTIFHV